jgi:predicted lipoprotein with Yx(FWY)xxD motif
MIVTRLRFAAVAAAAVVLAACGSSSKSGSATTAAAGAGSSATTAAASATTAAAGPTTTYDSSAGGYGYPAPATTAASSATTAASSATTAAATGSGSSVALASVGSFGQVLVDAKGMSLYMYANDTSGTSTCVSQCATNWPPAMAAATPTAGAGLDSSKLSTVSRGEGTKQLVYAGHPLYTYAADAAPGQASGQGVGGVWFLLNAAGEQVKAA